MKIAILIPCYNESKTIGKVVTDFKTALPEAEVYVYDNNSTDHTDAIAQEAGAIVRYEHRQGKGNVIRTMFREIDADCYLVTDGDDTYPSASARQMVDMVLSQQKDMVVGDRLSSNYEDESKRPFHRFGNRFVRHVINHLFHGSLKDILTGYRALSFQYVKSFPVLSQGFEIETEMSIHALDKNLNIGNVVVDYKERPADNPSKLNTFSDGFKVLKKVLTLYKEYQPFSFFCFLSCIGFVTSAILFIPILIEYFQTGLVPRFPTLIVSGSLLVLSLLLLTCGLILDTIARKHRQQFEIELNLLRIIHTKQ